MPTAKERREALKRRAQESQNTATKGSAPGVLDLSGIDNYEFYKMKTGKNKNVIDIVPFIVSEDWYAKLRSKGGKPTKTKVGYEDYKLEIPVHFKVGPEEKSILCLRHAFGKTCEVCNAYTEAKDSGASDEELASYAVKWRVIYNVYDYDEPDKGFQLWDCSYHLFEKPLWEEITLHDEGVHDGFFMLEGGETLEFRGKEKSFKTLKYAEAQSFDFTKREDYDENTLEEVFALDKLLVIPTPEEVAKIFHGLDDDDETPDKNTKTDDEDEDEDKDKDKSKTRTRGRTKDKKKEKKDDGECPYDHEFGVDCNEKEDCQLCDEDLFEKCSNLQEELEAKEKKTKTRRRK